MKRITCLLLIGILFSCTQENAEMQSEINALKEKLVLAEKKMATNNATETAFIHTVYFWFKEDVTDQQKEDFNNNGLAVLAKAPTIHKVFYGPPAGTPREVVDNSYDVAWICHFKNAADQDAYQVEPIHLKFVEDYMDLWERVQVYDNLISNK